jgi:tetratricopeptide (TPR) repeat protein
MIRFDFRWSILKWRAIGFLLRGLRSQAAATFSEMVEAYPNNIYALSSLAHLRAELNDKPSAIRLYQRALAQPGATAAMWFNLAFLQEESKDLQSAEASFRKALALSDSLDRAWYGLGLVLIQLGRLDEAVDCLKRNTKLQPMSPYAWYQLARVHIDRHEPDEALKIIQHLKGFEPKFAAQLERETGLKAS